MDLGTVKKKLNNIEYPSPCEFIADIDQIFINCHEYNVSESVVGRAATNLRTAFDARLNKAGLDGFRINKVNHPNKKRRTT